MCLVYFRFILTSSISHGILICKRMKLPFDFVINIFFPEICICCRTTAPNHFCESCMGQLVAVATHATECIVCKEPTSQGNLCSTCISNSQLDQLYVTFDYQKSHVHSLIHAFKYQNIRNLARPLAQILSETIPETPDPSQTLLIPIPIHPSRKAFRGYNQAELLAEELSTYISTPMKPILSKTKNTRSQTTLSREARQTNLSNSFKISTEIPQHIRKIYLIDDVTTTLSTLHEATLTLRKHTNAEIIGLTLAHNQDTSQQQDLLI